MSYISVGSQKFARNTTVSEENDLAQAWQSKNIINLNNQDRTQDTINLTSFVSGQTLTTEASNLLKGLTAPQLEGFASLLAETSKNGTPADKTLVSNFLIALNKNTDESNHKTLILQKFNSFNGVLPNGVAAPTPLGLEAAKSLLNITVNDKATIFGRISDFLYPTAGTDNPIATPEQLEAVVILLKSMPSQNVKPYIKQMARSNTLNPLFMRNLTYVANQINHNTWRPTASYAKDLKKLETPQSASEGIIPLMTDLHLNTTNPLSNDQKTTLTGLMARVLTAGPNSARAALGRILAQAADPTVYEVVKNRLTAGVPPAVTYVQWCAMDLSYQAIKAGRDDLDSQLTQLASAGTTRSGLNAAAARMFVSLKENLAALKQAGLTAEQQGAMIKEMIDTATPKGDTTDTSSADGWKRHNLYRMFFGRVDVYENSPLKFDEASTFASRAMHNKILSLANTTDNDFKAQLSALFRQHKNVLQASDNSGEHNERAPRDRAAAAMANIINGISDGALRTRAIKAFFGNEVSTVTAPATPFEVALSFSPTSILGAEYS